MKFKKLITVKYAGKEIDEKHWDIEKVNGSIYTTCSDAGNYTVTLKALNEYKNYSSIRHPGNFTNATDATFTIKKEKVHPVAVESAATIEKVYDGSTAVPTEILADKSTYDAINDANVVRSKILTFNRESGGSAAYSSKDVGTKDIYLSNLTVNNNYELTSNKLTLPGKITVAKLDNASTVSAAPLLYTGTAQQPEVVYDIKGIAGDSGKGIPAERSTNAENDGTTANPIDGLEILYKVHNAEDGTYSTEVPSSKEIGTHTVDYKVTSTNYEDLTGTFDVQIQKMNLADAYVGFEDSSPVYTGSALDPGVTVKGSETSEDIVSGENYTVKYQRVQDVSGNTVTEEAVTAPTEAGTYNVIITAKQESTFCRGAKMVEKASCIL